MGVEGKEGRRWNTEGLTGLGGGPFGHVQRGRLVDSAILFTGEYSFDRIRIPKYGSPVVEKLLVTFRFSHLDHRDKVRGHCPTTLCDTRLWTGFLRSWVGMKYSPGDTRGMTPCCTNEIVNFYCFIFIYVRHVQNKQEKDDS